MQQVLSKFHLPILSCIGLLLFVGVFSGVVLWVFRKGSSESYQKMSSLPISEESI